MIEITETVCVDGPPDSDGDICLNVYQEGEQVFCYLNKSQVEKILSVFDGEG